MKLKDISVFILVLDVLLIGEIINDYLLTGEHIILASASAGVLALHERLSRGPHIGQLPPRAIQGCPGAIDIFIHVGACTDMYIHVCTCEQM